MATAILRASGQTLHSRQEPSCHGSFNPVAAGFIGAAVMFEVFIVVLCATFTFRRFLCMETWKVDSRGVQTTAHTFKTKNRCRAKKQTNNSQRVPETTKTETVIELEDSVEQTNYYYPESNSGITQQEHASGVVDTTLLEEDALANEPSPGEENPYNLNRNPAYTRAAALETTGNQERNLPSLAVEAISGINNRLIEQETGMQEPDGHVYDSISLLDSGQPNTPPQACGEPYNHHTPGRVRLQTDV